MKPPNRSRSQSFFALGCVERLDMLSRQLREDDSPKRWEKVKPNNLFIPLKCARPYSRLDVFEPLRQIVLYGLLLTNDRQPFIPVA